MKLPPRKTKIVAASDGIMIARRDADLPAATEVVGKVVEIEGIG